MTEDQSESVGYDLSESQEMEGQVEETEFQENTEEVQQEDYV